MAPVLSLIIILAVSILITRIASNAIMHTGLSKQSAKFQARSAFTGVGFTTREAERVTEHPLRRKIVMLLMLLGNAGIVSAMATLILTFVNKGENDFRWYWDLLIIAGAVAVLWLLSTSKLFDRWLSQQIDKALNKYTDLNVRDYTSLLKLSGDYQITELGVEEDDWIEGKALEQCALRKEGINVLAIIRADGTYIGAPHGETRIESGDNMIIYGQEDNIRNLDVRKKGRKGAAEHRKATTKQKKKEKSEEEKDLERKEKN
ncbi:MAG: TrkA C-terminal domain-containing protein [Bacteroidales bacterium]|nr:TrkA C-terminal domain-containing protein [Bacteroidales bacterium]MCF8386946.1 TrkA C-terminal domain-containing protein [Bacteroidales bacterium]MCF8397439.1 TrkA C-terminal domain-containing protein [Bacteroidales bacterium]